MPTKITFEIWAGLQTGRIAHINESGHIGCLMKRADEFVMEKFVNGKQERHALLICITDDIRLNSHWQAFAQSKPLPLN